MDNEDDQLDSGWCRSACAEEPQDFSLLEVHFYSGTTLLIMAAVVFLTGIYRVF